VPAGNDLITIYPKIPGLISRLIHSETSLSFTIGLLLQGIVLKRYNQTRELVEKHPALIPATTFVGGFLFDIFTLARIDEIWGIAQQAAYLAVCGFVLFTLFAKPENTVTKRKWLEKVLQYRIEALHFLFGALLSSYTIFYFKSSSFSVSFAFLTVIVFLLIANEIPQFQSMGLGVKSALLALCYFSFFAYAIPILGGYIGPFIFLASLLVACLFLFFL